MATTLGSVAEGSIVYLKESGSRVAFYVAKHDYESALNGAGRTLLVRKDCYDQRRWHSSQLNVYPDSEIDVWLNNTWLKVLDGFVQREAAETTLYYIAGNGSDTKLTMKRAAFLLSATEVGLSSTSHIVEAGTTLPTASTIKIANYDGVAAAYWTRTPRKSNTKNPISVGANGNMGYLQLATYAGFYSRPCITLPAEMGVDGSNNVTETTAQILHGAMINNVLCVTKKCYAMIDGVLCAVPYGLANIDGVMTKIQFEEPEPPAPPVQTYTVTIRTSTPGYTAVNYAYFQINGTKYSGSPTETLSVDEGTAWSVYTSSGLAASGVYMNGTYTNERSGVVTSNMDVDIRGAYNQATGFQSYYIYITT